MAPKRYAPKKNLKPPNKGGAQIKKPAPKPKPKGSITKPKPKPAPPKPTPTSPFKESVYNSILKQLTNYGLPANQDIIEAIKKGLTNGDTEATIDLTVQNTQTWKVRFAGNEKLKAAGLPVLSPGEYLATERSYAQAMKNFGVPVGFYDDPADFAEFIGKSVSPAEIQQRLQAASDVASREYTATKTMLARMGLTNGSLIAQALDPSRARPLIERQMNAVKIGSSAIKSGVDVTTDYVERLASFGLSEEAALQGFGQVGQMKGLERLGDVHGVAYSQSDALSEVFDNNADALERRRKISTAERSAFSGSSTYGVQQKSTGGQY